MSRRKRTPPQRCGGSSNLFAQRPRRFSRPEVDTAAFEEPVLRTLPGSRLRYSGHDDCYLHVESTDQAVPAALLGRLLALLAGSALADVSPAQVPEPNSAITASLILAHPHWTGRLSAVSADAVNVSLAAAAEPWRLGHSLPERTDRLLTFDVRQGLWRVSRGPGPG